MVGINERNALCVLVDRGFSVSEARAALDRLTPLATYEGARFFAPGAIYDAKREA